MLPHEGHPVTVNSSPPPSNSACSCEIAASSFNHSSNTTIQYTAFFTVFGFFLLNVAVFLTKEFFGEFCLAFAGLESFCTVPGLGKLSVLRSIVLPLLGLSEFKLSQDSLSDRLELVLALALLARLSKFAFPSFWLPDVSRDFFRMLGPPLPPKLLGGGPSCRRRVRPNSEESVFCLKSLRAVVGLFESECFTSFTGGGTSMTTLWMLARLFSSRRIKFFLARRSRRSSPSVWSAIFSTLILTELRIWGDVDK